MCWHKTWADLFPDSVMVRKNSLSFYKITHTTIFGGPGDYPLLRDGIIRSGSYILVTKCKWKSFLNDIYGHKLYHHYYLW